MGTNSACGVGARGPILVLTTGHLTDLEDGIGMSAKETSRQGQGKE